MNGRWKILITNATDIYGGGEFYVLELATALRQRGHGAYIACKPLNLLAPKAEAAGVPVIPIDFPAKGRLFRYVRTLTEIIRREDIGIIHTNSNYDRTAGAFAARRESIPHVTNVHSFHSVQHNVTHWIRNQFATDHFIVDGVCVRDLLVNGDRIDPARISVVHLGVDPGSMKRDERLRASVRRELGVSEGEILIGTVGRMVPMKGQEYLVRAFTSIAPSFPSARLAIIGDGDLGESLRRMASDLGIGDRILFPGFRDDLVAVYSAFDIYVHPSVEGGGETFPFAVLQALSQELPVVVTRVGDVPAMVMDGKNGFVVPDRDPDSLGRAMSTLLQDAALRRRLAAGSRELLLHSFTTDRMVDAVEAIYRRILAERT